MLCTRDDGAGRLFLHRRLLQMKAAVDVLGLSRFLFLEQTQSETPFGPQRETRQCSPTGISTPTQLPGGASGHAQAAS